MPSPSCYAPGLALTCGACMAYGTYSTSPVSRSISTGRLWNRSVSALRLADSATAASVSLAACGMLRACRTCASIAAAVSGCSSRCSLALSRPDQYVHRCRQTRHHSSGRSHAARPDRATRQLGKSIPVHNIKFYLPKGWGNLIFDDFHTCTVANHLLPALNGIQATNIQTDRGIEFERVPTPSLFLDCQRIRQSSGVSG